jgi:outer membrane protein assembly factor BamB
MATGAYTTLYQVPDLSGDDDIPAAPTYDNGNLYFGNKDGIFFSISASTGAVNWQYNTGFSGDFGIYGSSAVYNGLAWWSSSPSAARRSNALNESNGPLACSYTTNGRPNSPVVAGGVVFVASYAGKLLALNAATGALLWSAPLGANVPTGVSERDGVPAGGQRRARRVHARRPRHH